eukprot:scaffold2179_cov165-Amphora_coffeaeformis.AAC.12
MTPIKVLLTGASGYVGQFLLESFLASPPFVGAAAGEQPKEYLIHAIHRSSPSLKSAVEKIQEQQQQQQQQQQQHKITIHVDCVDIGNSEEITEFLAANGPMDVCIHTAAISSPKACTDNPELARRVNIPAALFDALLSQANPTKIVAFSTDHVYDGLDAPYANESADKANPVNDYGKSKLEMETYLNKKSKAQESQNRKHRIHILRPTVIFGPKPPLCQFGVNTNRETFLHFIASRKDSSTPTNFFVDEYRNPLSVRDLVAVVRYFVFEDDGSNQTGESNTDDDSCDRVVEVYNVCGPRSYSRYDMAVSVLVHLGVTDHSPYLRAVKKSELKPKPAIQAPVDLEMSCQKILNKVGAALEQFTTFDQILVDTFGEKHTT